MIYATAGNIKQLEKLINKFFYSENYYIDEKLEIKNKIKKYSGSLKVKKEKEKYILYK